MKLTNTLREAFVRGAMNDVPTVEHLAQAQKLIRDEAQAALPKEIKAILADPKLAYYIQTSTHVYVEKIGYVYCVRPDGFKPSARVLEKATKLYSLHAEQKRTLDALKSKLTSAANAVTTRKALADLLPEFEKYLPTSDAAICKTLPAVANIVADFAKAGWPKDKKAAKAT